MENVLEDYNLNDVSLFVGLTVHPEKVGGDRGGF